MSYLGITLFIIFASLVLYLASFVSYHVSRSESLEAGQKRAIYLLAWLLPLIGPAITVAALGDDFAQTKKKDSIPLLSYIFLAGVFAPSRDGSEESGYGNSNDAAGGGDGDV
ncbi:hypothetical protein [uncultured Thalassolituus sp.]|uniref:hypothetical protein n=1 Tax=uncultured Thalassolituus sp. TaxID=285273 RepID=UPI00260935D0|nr:hypothetical protein [uncultured Thalassolituus sp.]